MSLRLALCCSIVLLCSALGSEALESCAASTCNSEEALPDEAGLLQTGTKAWRVSLEESRGASSSVEALAASEQAFWGRRRRSCVYQQFKAKHAKDHIVYGTSENMDKRIKEVGIDLTGLWWMRGNPVQEVLASFAGATLNSTTFPLQLQVPNALAGHWSWEVGVAGTALMKFYSLSSPEANMLIDFANSTHGDIDTGLKQNPAVLVEEWGFDFLNEDEWNRTTTFQDNSPVGALFGHNWYTLTRVLKEDGSPTKFWNEFLNSDDGKGMHQYFATNSSCLRRCRVTVLSCTVCSFACR